MGAPVCAIDSFSRLAPNTLQRRLNTVTEAVSARHGTLGRDIHEKILAAAAGVALLAGVTSANAEVVKVGVIANFSGAFAIWGQQFKQSVEDPVERDIIQRVYLRRVEKRDGKLVNIDFYTSEMVKDPWKLANPNAK